MSAVKVLRLARELYDEELTARVSEALMCAADELWLPDKPQKKLIRWFFSLPGAPANASQDNDKASILALFDRAIDALQKNQNAFEAPVIRRAS